jgi:CCR4-NOT transcriptional regulation complex NOT5 subunit
MKWILATIMSVLFTLTLNAQVIYDCAPQSYEARKVNYSPSKNSCVPVNKDTKEQPAYRIRVAMMVNFVTMDTNIYSFYYQGKWYSYLQGVYTKKEAEKKKKELGLEGCAWVIRDPLGGFIYR